MAQAEDFGFGTQIRKSPYFDATVRWGAYHADADIETNPDEFGLDRLVNLDMEAEFIGKAALMRIEKEGVRRKQLGLVIHGAPLKGPNTTFWAVSRDGAAIGTVTSAVYSPRLKQNIALAMVSTKCAQIGTEVEVASATDPARATIVERPFYDPKEVARRRLHATARQGPPAMTDLSIQLHWQRAEPELRPGTYSNAHTEEFNGSHDLQVDAAPDWGR